MLWNYFKIVGEILAFLKYTSKKMPLERATSLSMIERLEIFEKLHYLLVSVKKCKKFDRFYQMPW